jgi:DNA-binding CsgD family transcriptional regulator
MPATAYLVMTNVPPQKWLGTLRDQRQVLGRGDEVDLRVPPEYTHVSRKHAEFWIDSTGYWVNDLDSTSGTRINSVPLAPNQAFRLTLGDHIWLGAAEFDFVANPDLARRRPFPKSEDETIGYGTGPGETVKFSGASAHYFSALSQAELDVVLWMSRGFTDPDEIANMIHRSPHTIRSHFGNIFSKLGVHSRDQLLSCLLRRISATPE